VPGPLVAVAANGAFEFVDDVLPPPDEDDEGDGPAEDDVGDGDDGVVEPGLQLKLLLQAAKASAERASTPIDLVVMHR
jgi:hypothetical protein